MVSQRLRDVLIGLDAQRNAAVASLQEFLRIPSVSTSPDHRTDMDRCAAWLAQRLRSASLNSVVLSTGGHPVVVAHNDKVAGRPSVLFYGHYDVQPPEPLEQWVTPPFRPTIRDGAIYARGAADDKGQVWAHIQAIMEWQKSAGGLPINLTILIEGEEEIGSEHLAAFIDSNKRLLKSDIAVISDTNQFSNGVPAITYGLRGLVYVEVTVTGPSHDLHSGLYGGAVPNPANVLASLIASLHEHGGRINIPGFYDGVVDPSPEERKAWAALPFDEQDFTQGAGLSALSGETDYTPLERMWARPTCDVNGLTSGYQGHGAKTIIPSTASAKISLRLVPGQNPEHVIDCLTRALKHRCPKNVKLDIHRHSAAEAVLVSMDSPAMRRAAQAIEIGFGRRPAFIRGGGSIPVVSLLKASLGIDTLMVGFGLPDDRVHSPNEKFNLDAFHAGTRTAAALYERLAELKA
jgi:acetylornithine deacetylase/succinyl-diaminopimelate desuccinylase-like protein